jgi:hypothetical protein
MRQKRMGISAVKTSFGGVGSIRRKRTILRSSRSITVLVHLFKRTQRWATRRDICIIVSTFYDKRLLVCEL